MGLNLKRIQAGRLAKSNGQNFETIFEATCYRNGLAVTRIPDGCKQIGARRLIRVKSPFDFVITHQNKSALIDTKTENNKVFPHARIVEHQVMNLIGHETRGTPAGYVVWLRAIEKVVFIPATLLAQASTKRGSISADTPGVITLGTITTMNIKLILNKPESVDNITK